jgi:GTPase SAR1 family protein
MKAMNNEDKKLIVAVFGTANTGKSTLIEDIVNYEDNKKRDADKQWTLFGKDYRQIISERGLKINRDGNEECQQVIHDTLLQNIIDAVDEPFLKRIIMDRTILDSFAYTYWHNKFGKGGISQSTIEKMWYQVAKFSRVFDALMYIPLCECNDIEVVDDKFRDTNLEYRKQIDKIFNVMWLTLIGDGARMDVIYGSREKRVEWFYNDKEYLMLHDKNWGYSSFSKFERTIEQTLNYNGN